MPKLPIIKTQVLIRVLERLGFFRHNQVGSHAQYKHLDGRRITIPVHYGKDVDKKMLKGIIGDLGMVVEEFISFLKKKK